MEAESRKILKEIENFLLTITNESSNNARRKKKRQYAADKKNEKANGTISSILNNNDLGTVENYAIFTGENAFAVSFDQYGELVEKYDALIKNDEISKELNDEEKVLWDDLKDKDKFDIWVSWKKYPEFKESRDEDFFNKGSFLMSQISKNFDSNAHKETITKVMKDKFENLLMYNEIRNLNLKKELKKEGYEYFDVEGKYGNLENSIFVYNIPIEKVEELSGKFGQESFVYAKLNEQKDSYDIGLYFMKLTDEEKDRLLAKFIDNPSYEIEENIPYEKEKSAKFPIHMDKDEKEDFTKVKGSKKTDNVKFTYNFENKSDLKGYKAKLYEILKSEM